MMKRFLLYPWLIALYPVVALYVHNYSETPITSLALAGILALTLTGVLILSWDAWVKDRRKAAMLASWCLLIFYSYGHLHTAILSLFAEHRFAKAEFELLDALVHQEAVLHWYLLPGLLLTAALGCSILLRRSIPDPLHTIANTFAVALLALPLLGALPAVFHAIRRTAPDMAGMDHRGGAGPTDLGDLPDIYCIILDGYARGDVLKKYYGFDNSAFLSHLESKGFYIATDGRSNYDYTFLSLPSMLNMTHLLDLAVAEGPNSRDLTIPYRMIRENRVTRILKSKGYRYVHMNSTWAATRRNAMADYTISYGSDIAGDEFLRVLVETTLLKPAVAKIDHRLADIHRHGLAGLFKVPDIKEPTFTFAHFTPPHYPYVFDRDGNVVQDAPLSRQFATSEWDRHDLYIGQVQFMNREITKLVDHLLAKSERPPVILVVSDHGPKAGKTIQDYVHVRFGNLAALHFPEKARAQLYPAITPVNYFRTLLRSEFGEDLPPLPDASYFTGRMETPYQMRPLPPNAIPAAAAKP